MPATGDDGVCVRISRDQAGKWNVFVVRIGVSVVVAGLLLGIFCEFVKLPPCKVYVKDALI